VAARESSTAEEVRVAQQLQAEHSAQRRDLDERAGAVASAVLELQALKGRVEEVSASLAKTVDEAGRSEAQANEAWTTLREHMASLATDNGLTLASLLPPKAPVRYLRSGRKLHDEGMLVPLVEKSLISSCTRGMQEELPSLAMSAAKAAHSELVGIGSDAVDALDACGALRATLTHHAAALQRWAIELQMHGTRQGQVQQQLAQQAEQLEGLERLRDDVERQQSDVRQRLADLTTAEVR
jgi:chromosome segregation ATPase